MIDRVGNSSRKVAKLDPSGSRSTGNRKRQHERVACKGQIIKWLRGRRDPGGDVTQRPLNPLELGSRPLVRYRATCYGSFIATCLNFDTLGESVGRARSSRGPPLVRWSSNQARPRGRNRIRAPFLDDPSWKRSGVKTNNVARRLYATPSSGLLVSRYFSKSLIFLFFNIHVPTCTLSFKASSGHGAYASSSLP